MRFSGRIKDFVNRPLHRAGLDLRRWTPAIDLESSRRDLIERNGVDMVIDVGANHGQYVEGLRRSGYRGRVVSIEPLQSALEVLSTAADRDPNWKVIRAAAGSTSGRMDLQVAGNSASSSLLPMLDRHVGAAPESAVTGTESVEVAPLDDLVRDHVTPSSAAFMKVDVQGFEAEVIRGAEDLLDGGRLVGIELELSLVSLYEGQPLWDEVVEMVRGSGFVPVAFGAGFRDPRSGELLQIDGLFARPANFSVADEDISS